MQIHNQASKTGSRFGLKALGALCVLVLQWPIAASANPDGAQVLSGQVNFKTLGSQLDIHNTPGAIINWNGFSINANEVTRFIQQSASSAVLNRVIGQDPSRILGALLSNGRVFRSIPTASCSLPVPESIRRDWSPAR